MPFFLDYKGMRNIFSLVAFVALFSFIGCGGHSHDNHSHAHDEHVHSNVSSAVCPITKYSDSLEIFVEMEQLVSGRNSHVTAYITRLSNFKPIEPCAVDVTLEVNGSRLSQTVDPLHQGVYEFHLSPEVDGKGILSFVIGNETVSLPVSVHAGCNHASEEEHHHHSHETGESAHSGTHVAAGAISFLKEQSWKIDFSTGIVGSSNFNGAVKVAAKVSAAPGNEASIVATSAGKVQYAGNIVAGKDVSAGELLFIIDGGDVTENDASVKFAEAESAYRLAKANYERKELLYREKIVSESDFLQAQSALRVAEANYSSMKRSFSGDKVQLKSPMTGYISNLLAVNGDYVAAGTPLAMLQCDGEVNIAAELPVRFASLLANINNINIEVADGRVCSLAEAGGRVVAVGRTANNCGMIPLTLSVKKLWDVLPGSIVTLHITSLLADGQHSVAVPRSALVEEMGNYFVFVQITPVAFEKREVNIGATDGKYTRIVKGLHKGERIVTKGAMSLKLSQGAATLDPHAGHVH